MKNKSLFLITMLIILTTIQACSAGPGVQPTKVEQQATLAGDATNPAAVSSPTQEVSEVGLPAGPETIDLTNSALFIRSNTPAYTFDAMMEYSGMDTIGAAKEVTLTINEQTQSIPEKSNHFTVLVTGGEGGGENVILGDQGYLVYQETCLPFSTSNELFESASEGMPILQELITGQAQRVETGIEVNGYVTDKYELTSENMLEEDELVSAFAYMARDGGFITRFEAQTRLKTDYQGFDSNQFTDLVITHNYIPVEDGSLVITIPAACVP